MVLDEIGRNDVLDCRAMGKLKLTKLISDGWNKLWMTMMMKECGQHIDNIWLLHCLIDLILSIAQQQCSPRFGRSELA